MKKDISISVKNLSKKYIIGERKMYLTLREQINSIPKKIVNKSKKNGEVLWALNNISFDIKKGDVVGIIGKNGAGKSTLLKILSKIVEPTSGTVMMRGKVASMLEVGTGFKAELTGRENIYLSGAIIGMTRKEIEYKFDSIVDFSGINKFIDTPVKKYSSGMYVRLAFAVAAHLDADILLIDEVLAVGDAEFQKKCLGKMDDLSKSGRTVLFVSHNLSSIKKLCKSVVLLKNGKVTKYGDTDQVISSYLKNNLKKKSIIKFANNKKLNAQINSIKMDDKEENITFEVNIVNRIQQKMYIAYSIQNDFNEILFFERDIEKNPSLLRKRKIGNFKYKISIEKSIFLPGRYYFEIGIANYNSREIIHLPKKLLHFDIEKKDQTFGFPSRGKIQSKFKLKIT